jgi:hypothetical protein
MGNFVIPPKTASKGVVEMSEGKKASKVRAKDSGVNNV